MNELPKAGGTDSILANLFKNMLSELRITAGKGGKWEELMRAFLNDGRNGIRQNDRDRSCARGNLAKELLKDKMTWKVFCKGMRFIGLTGFEITIKAYHGNGSQSMHTAKIAMVETFESEDDDEQKHPSNHNEENGENTQDPQKD